MANIAVTNYCNLKCQYCFADDMIQEKTKSITLDDFRKMLSWLSRTGKNHVGIIGGEPTLHPQFDEILKETNIYCREVHTGATLFTNGIELKKWVPYIGEQIGLLINCNSPESQGEEKFNKQREALDHIHDLCWFSTGKANCGCNIHLNETKYDFIWDIVDRYKLPHLRTSVVSPGACYEVWRKDKESYYNEIKPVYIDFCKEAIKHNCKLNMDCGHIPSCYFSREELDIVQKACQDNRFDNGWCDPVVDITPDFKATACFGSYDPIDIRDFDDLIQLERYLQIKKNVPRAAANGTGRCSTCKKHELLQCQGGCLGFGEV